MQAKSGGFFKRKQIVLWFVLLLVFYIVQVLAGNNSSIKKSLNDTNNFIEAQPVWGRAYQNQMNRTLGFRAIFTSQGNETHTLRITGGRYYHIYLNGEHLAFGPARGPHGWTRVDEYKLENLKDGINLLAIEVVGYNVNSYDAANQPPFLQAEIEKSGRIIAHTAIASSEFQAILIDERVQKVPRYSFQRPMMEYWKLTPNSRNWINDPNIKISPIELVRQNTQKLLPRRVPQNKYKIIVADSIISRGAFRNDYQPDHYWQPRYYANFPEYYKAFRPEQLDKDPLRKSQQIKMFKQNKVQQILSSNNPLQLETDESAIIKFDIIRTGFPGLKIECDQPTTLYWQFDEILVDGDIDLKRYGCVNVVVWELEKGNYELEAFATYDMKYVKLMVMKGSCKIDSLYIREYAAADVFAAKFKSSDPDLNKIFEAGRQTYRQNASDIFMDCPSRERAGWLCDSYFAARVAADLSGHSRVEKNFLENFALPDSFAHLPEGMLPMCYPADHPDSVFIPNWAMWLFLELEEYYQRTGDKVLVDAFEIKYEQLIDYFRPFENEYGLLENLEKWVFIEWSKANAFVQDVNYPTNMLYAELLEVGARLYGKKDLSSKAANLRQVIRKQAFDDQFFIDNAVRNESGELKMTDNRTEVCQYFAFFSNVATPEFHPQLWNILTTDFGPEREKEGLWPEIWPANSFVGNYLRMEILSRYDETNTIIKEIPDYWLYMAERTGTLWENKNTAASCNHGFASHACHVLYRDALGLYKVNRIDQKVIIRFTNNSLKRCQGSMPVAAGLIKMNWEKTDDTIRWSLEIPENWTYQFENLTDLQLIKED